MGRFLLKAGDSATPVEVQLEHTVQGEVEAYRYRQNESNGVVEVDRLGQGGGWLRLDGAVVPYHALRQGDQMQVWVRGRIYRFQVADGAARRVADDGTRKARPSDRVSAPMPGTVRRITVRPGDTFEAHQPLVIMESMKMELTLSVPHVGRVQEIACREGQLVEMGAILLRLEPPGDETKR